MSKTYKILAEKYNQIYENDAGAGLERLSKEFINWTPKEFKLFGFFKYITSFGPQITDDGINSILDEWYVIADGELAADSDTLDDDMADYEADPKEVYNDMLNTIDDAFDAPAADYTAGIDINDVKARIKEWFDSRY